ncbi:MAG: SPFH domain-containing protein [Gammaproteobacteria bacterium]
MEGVVDASVAQSVAIWIGILILIGIIVLAFIKANLHICPPNEVLILSGRKRKLADGTEVGYRIIKGGRGFRMPIVEIVHRMSLTTIPITIDISGALSSGSIPINIKGMANVKVAGTVEAGLHNAIERFLSKPPEQISHVAKEVLEGNVRGVLATLSPEDANSKRLEFAHSVMQEAQDDLKKLGLVLDTLKILNISDDQDYLESIGRKKNAEVRRDAMIAEAEADAEARRVAAESKQKGNVAEAEANVVISEAENKLRVKRAELAVQANESEERANVAGAIARVVEEQKLESHRVELNKMRHQADIVIPAAAEKEAKELQAAGDAARIIEEGIATAESVRLMREQWEEGDTRDLFLIQQLPDIISKITDIISENLSIERLTIIDSGSGNGIPTLVKGLTGSIVAVMEEIKNATGLDIVEILKTREKHDQ